MLKRGDFMESFFVALNAVLPMFIMLFIGFLVRKLKILQAIVNDYINTGEPSASA